jgi:hypothetical protein
VCHLMKMTFLQVSPVSSDRAPLNPRSPSGRTLLNHPRSPTHAPTLQLADHHERGRGPLATSVTPGHTPRFGELSSLQLSQERVLPSRGSLLAATVGIGLVADEDTSRVARGGARGHTASLQQQRTVETAH